MYVHVCTCIHVSQATSRVVTIVTLGFSGNAYYTIDPIDRWPGFVSSLYTVQYTYEKGT